MCGHHWARAGVSAGAAGTRGRGPYQEEAGTDELPAQPPVEAGSLPRHLLDVITELPHAWVGEQPGRAVRTALDRAALKSS